MNKANIFMASGWIGLAGIGVFVITPFLVTSMGLTTAGGLIAVAACWAMLFTRGADEYTRGLWTAAASMAFATMLVLFLSIPFLEGVYDGYNDARNGTDNAERDIPALLTIACAIGAFYVGLFWKRVRGV